MHVSPAKAFRVHTTVDLPPHKGYDEKGCFSGPYVPQYAGDTIMTFRKASRVFVTVSLIGLVLCICAWGALRWQMQSALDECGRTAQALSLIHISEPTRPY